MSPPDPSKPVIFAADKPLAVGELVFPVPVVLGLALKVLRESTREEAVQANGQHPPEVFQHFYECRIVRVQPEQRSVHGAN
jgi:hypothetical protein